MITQQKITEIVNKIALNYKPEKIIPFGSYAEGNPTEDSDLDFLIIKDTDKSSYERDMEVRRLLRGSKAPLDIPVYTNKEINKWKDLKTSFESYILKTGKILYAKG